jgi:hypothetical protein
MQVGAVSAIERISSSPMRTEPYNPGWLVALARRQHPEKPWLADAFARCNAVIKRAQFIIHFVDPTDANQPGAEWQFDTTLWMKDPVEGNLVVDVLKGGRIGAVEFYDRLFGRAD